MGMVVKTSSLSSNQSSGLRKKIYCKIYELIIWIYIIRKIYCKIYELII